MRLSGTLRTVTLRPRGGVPALEAELDDGTGVIIVVWLGRRRIAGIGAGPLPDRAGSDRRARGAPGDVQPALRAAAVTEDARGLPAHRRHGRGRVRRQMAAALGGRRGMVETAIPGILFTVLWLTTKNLQAGAHRQPDRRDRRAGGAARAALHPAVRDERAGGDRHRLGLRALGRERRGDGGGAGTGLLPAGHPLQHRLGHRDGDLVPGRLAVHRVPGRQRHRRPHRLARRSADRRSCARG